MYKCVQQCMQNFIKGRSACGVSHFLKEKSQMGKHKQLPKTKVEKSLFCVKGGGGLDLEYTIGSVTCSVNFKSAGHIT